MRVNKLFDTSQDYKLMFNGKVKKSQRKSTNIRKAHTRAHIN